MTKKSWAIFIVTLLFLQTPELYADWGKGNLTVSEGSFYIERFERVIENWTQKSFELHRDADFKIIDNYKSLLVIDLDKQAIWIEDNGQILKEYYVEFPAGLRWNFYHATPKGNTDLTGKTCLRTRGVDLSRLNPEIFCLVGQNRNDRYILFEFHYNMAHGDLREGVYAIKPYKFGTITNPDKLYGSLIVTDKEYQKYRKSLPDSIVSQTNEDSTPPEILPELGKNKAAWDRIEKKIYLEIERQVLNAGYELRKLTVNPGPDFSASHAEISAGKDSLIRRIFGGSSSAKSYLKIDYLGNDIWYAKSATIPSRLPPSRNRLDLEFLISLIDKLTGSQRSDLLAKGRKIPTEIPIPQSKWNATLPNGTTIEFIGICENPSFGKKWWGPDGSTLDFVPYMNTEPYTEPDGRRREDIKIYEFAWRIKIPTGAPHGITYSVEDSTRSYSGDILDRYGSTVEKLSAKGYGFDKSRQTTTMKLRLRIGARDGDYQYVTFSNITLVPGQKKGFSIKLGEQ